MLAQLIPPQAPPVLILSYVRSGSTWVGAVLGRAANAMYMHEPINQVLVKGSHYSPFEEIRPSSPSREYDYLASVAFSGLPLFPPSVCRYGDQWNINKRLGRRMVIKEVNPWACAYLLHKYRPRLIFLVRHPVAISLSSRRLGWIPGHTQALVGRCQEVGRAWQHVCQHLKDYPYHTVVRYEDLCDNPQEEFRKLYKFGGLEWHPAVDPLISDSSREGDRADSYGITRNSQTMKTIWRTEIAESEVGALKAAYFEFDLPWYRDSSDW